MSINYAHISFENRDIILKNGNVAFINVTKIWNQNLEQLSMLLNVETNDNCITNHRFITYHYIHFLRMHLH